MEKEKTTNQDEWVMPEFMEKYRLHFRNTGGNSIESLMNDKTTNAFNNHVRSTLIVAVNSQVALLERLYTAGMLR